MAFFILISCAFSKDQLEQSNVLNKTKLQNFFEGQVDFLSPAFDFEIKRLPVRGEVQKRKRDFLKNLIDDWYVYPSQFPIEGTFSFLSYSNKEEMNAMVNCKINLGMNVNHETWVNCETKQDETYALKLFLEPKSKQNIFIYGTTKTVENIRYLSAELFSVARKDLPLLKYKIPFLGTKIEGKIFHPKKPKPIEVAFDKNKTTSDLF